MFREARPRDWRRVRPSVNQHYGICMLFTREPPSTFVWIIPGNKPVPVPSRSAPSTIRHRGVQAPWKADKWPQFVHFMPVYIIRGTSLSRLRSGYPAMCDSFIIMGKHSASGVMMLDFCVRWVFRCESKYYVRHVREYDRGFVRLGVISF